LPRVVDVRGLGAALTAEYLGTPSPAAHSTGHDAEWLGHAWVDRRKGQADVDRLAAAVRGVRLALGGRPTRDVGVAMYVDFAATPKDWDSYHRDWADVA
jgi:hypothetical protein